MTVLVTVIMNDKIKMHMSNRQKVNTCDGM